MTAYLLTWKPQRWPEERFDEYFDRYQAGETLKWSCGTTKKILPGGSFYLLKQGANDNGIIGSGIIINGPDEDIHYDLERAERGEKALYVNVRFDYLTASKEPAPISKHELPPSNLWNSQGSGKTIPDDVEYEIKKLWFSRVELSDFISADEISDTQLTEGAKKQIYVNSYERNADVRRKCIEHYGYHCAVCHFHFGLLYGSLGKNYIHVHHLTPISSVGKDYVVDPIKDLRPVCPNCHAMLHKENPPLTITQLRAIVSKYKNTY